MGKHRRRVRMRRSERGGPVETGRRDGVGELGTVGGFQRMPIRKLRLPGSYMPGCQRGSETLRATGLVASPGVWRQAEDVREVRMAAARRVVIRERGCRAGIGEGLVMVG